MPPKTNQPSDLELQVLSVLWDKGSATVREVHDKLPDGKIRAYTTVLTVMQKLEKKGLVTKETEGTAHVYSPTQSQEATVRPLLRDLVQNIFRGKVSTVVQHLLEDEQISDAELKEIRTLIRRHKSSQETKS